MAVFSFFFVFFNNRNHSQCILNTMVQKIIFGNILRINGTLHNHLPTHSSSINNFNQIHEILLGLEAAHKFGVIWGAVGGKEIYFEFILKLQHTEVSPMSKSVIQ